MSEKLVTLDLLRTVIKSQMKQSIATWDESDSATLTITGLPCIIRLNGGSVNVLATEIYLYDVNDTIYAIVCNSSDVTVEKIEKNKESFTCTFSAEIQGFAQIFCGYKAIPNGDIVLNNYTNPDDEVKSDVSELDVLTELNFNSNLQYEMSPGSLTIKNAKQTQLKIFSNSELQFSYNSSGNIELNGTTGDSVKLVSIGKTSEIVSI